MDFQDEIKRNLRTPEEAANAEIDAYVRYDIERMKQMLKYVASNMKKMELRILCIIILTPIYMMWKQINGFEMTAMFIL